MFSLFLQHCLLPPMARAVGRRFPSHSKRHSSSLLNSWDTLNQVPAEIPRQGSGDWMHYRKFRDLQDSLTRNSTPGRVWLNYTSLLDYMGHEKLDIKIHQAVLRKCTPPTGTLRYASSLRLRRRKRPNTNHLYEGRFQVVIQNIRALGRRPALNDYHFILNQFAAVGHHQGAMNVYRELIDVGIKPVNLTFGFCLQAIAHRLTLPIKTAQIPVMTSQVRAIMKDLLDDMRRHGIPFTAVNMDLTVRIMKYTVDEAGFESLLRMGYGIDMRHPDRPAPEVLGMRAGSHSVSSTEAAKPLPFSTSALNTVLDFYGMMGNVSKMVQAFEVLTVPLPHAQAHFNSSFEDEEDDFGVSPDSSTTFIPPHAEPNTTTYNTLFKHASRAGHSHIARHYFLMAMKLDRAVDRQLRINLVTKPYIHQVPAPRFSLNRQAILSVFGESNRDKNIGLMRWLHSKIPSILRRKRADLEFYESFVKGLQRRGQWPVIDESSSTDDDPVASETERRTPLNHYLPISDKKSERWGFVNGHHWRLSDIEDAFVDVTNQQPITGDEPFKPFALALHIRILERNIREISTLAKRIDDVLARTIERLKDRMGRRVWSGKNIYLLTGGSKRGRVSRQRWTNIVNYQPRKKAEEKKPREGVRRKKWVYNAWTETSEDRPTR